MRKRWWSLTRSMKHRVGTPTRTTISKMHAVTHLIHLQKIRSVHFLPTMIRKAPMLAHAKCPNPTPEFLLWKAWFATSASARTSLPRPCQRSGKPQSPKLTQRSRKVVRPLLPSHLVWQRGHENRHRIISKMGLNPRKVTTSADRQMSWNRRSSNRFWSEPVWASVRQSLPCSRTALRIGARPNWWLYKFKILRYEAKKIKYVRTFYSWRVVI